MPPWAQSLERTWVHSTKQRINSAVKSLYCAHLRFQTSAEWYSWISRPLAQFLFNCRIKVEPMEEHSKGALVTSNEVCVWF